MDVLRELIQTIIVIVVLAVLVEMLLPGGDMRRYVKMVMGLLIIMAVMQAAAGAIHSEIMRGVPGVTVSEAGAPPLEDIMAAGQELADTNRDRAAQQYSEGLSGQVLSLAGINPDVRAVDARVSIGGENGDISEIIIVFDAAARGPAGGGSGKGNGLSSAPSAGAGGGDGPSLENNAGAGDRQTANSPGEDLSVQPVVVDISGKDAADTERPVTAVTPEQKKAATAVTAVVAEFYNLKPEQVKYQFRE